MQAPAIAAIIIPVFTEKKLIEIIKTNIDESIIIIDLLILWFSFILEIKSPINIAGSAKSSPNYL